MAKFDHLVDEHGFIKWSDCGDATFLTSWLAIPACVHPDALQPYISNPRGFLVQFLKSFRTHCMKDDYLVTHPSRDDRPFSRDQLSPLLFLGAAILKYRPELTSLYKPILQKIVDLGNAHDNVAKDKHRNGDITPPIRYIIKLLSIRYGVGYAREENEHDLSFYLCLYSWYKEYGEAKAKKFVKVLFPKGVNVAKISKWTSWMLPKNVQKDFEEIGKVDVAKIVAAVELDSFSIWNNVALVGARVIMSTRRMTRHFKPFSDAWPHLPGYKIVVGKSYVAGEVERFKDWKINHLDIIHQRGGTGQTTGDIPCMDWPILKALEVIF